MKGVLGQRPADTNCSICLHIFKFYSCPRGPTAEQTHRPGHGQGDDSGVRDSGEPDRQARVAAGWGADRQQPQVPAGDVRRGRQHRHAQSEDQAAGGRGFRQIHVFRLQRPGQRQGEHGLVR